MSTNNGTDELLANNQGNSNVGNMNTLSDGSDDLSKTSDKYRAGFNIAGYNRFKSDSNPDGWTPRPHELSVDEQGNIYVWFQDEKGQFISKSVTKEITDQLTELKKLGILQNAEAFKLNGKIYNFIYDNDKMVLRLNTELDLFEDYRFYSVRKINRDPVSGDYIYITGIVDSETQQIITNLGQIYNDGERYVPSAVRMIETCTDGERYIVDFYDDSRTLIGSSVYYAKAGKTVDYSLSPDMALRDMIITTDRPAGEENVCFLYQNEDPNNLIIRVGLKYADGHVVDITEEGKTTGRLIFEGRDELNTSEIQLDPDKAQTITISYFFSADNQDQPIETEEDLQAVQSDPNTIVLTKTLKVLVKENIYDPIIDLLLHGYKDVGTGGITDIFKVKVYAKYASGDIRDITPVMDSTRFITTAKFAYNESTQCIEASEMVGSFTVQCLVPQGRATSLFKKTFACEFSEYNRRMNITRSEGGFDTKDTTKFTLFNVSQSKMRISETDNLQALKDSYSFKYNLEPTNYRVPNYVLIRHALKPEIYYTGTDLADAYGALTDPNGVVPYRIIDDNLLIDDTPLIVEFYQIVIDETTGARTAIFLTNAQRTYAKSTSTSL